MKQLILCIFTALLFLQAFSTSWALQLSVNQERYVPGDELVLTLIEDWPGEAEIYVAVTLPADNVLWFLMPPQNFVPDLVPYAQGVSASGSREILQMPLPVGLPVGEYTFYATAMYSIFDRIDDVAETSFIYATEAEPVELVLGDIRFPDGVMGRRYSLALEPESGTPPYQFSLSSGTLPDGLTLDKSSGLIQGEPSARGFAEFTVQVIDGQGNTGEIPGAINVYGVLTFGEHGTFKGCNGLQMAFNSIQDLDEIRIEQGTYDCVGTELAENKTIRHGIKISGGWDAEFKKQTIEPTLTVFDAGNQWIASADTEELCQEANGEWLGSSLKRCSKNTLIEGRFFSFNNNGPIAVENFSFKNAYSTFGNGGAILGQDNVTIEQCVFANNTASIGGAVSNVGTITDSTFSNNSAGSAGAVYVAGNITNSTFTNNSAYVSGGKGGAVFLVAGNITNSTFTKNSAENGGAIYFSDYRGSIMASVTNSTFTNNSASNIGGAIFHSYTPSSITNSTFTNNSASSAGAIFFSSYFSYITNSTFTNNSASGGGVVSNISGDGGAVYAGNGFSITNSIFTNNSASKNGGAINLGYREEDSIIINSIFNKNSASIGGAIFLDGEWGKDITIANTTIVNNSSSENGGGFYGKGTLLNSIFYQNTADSEANDITPNGNLILDYNLVNNLTGTYDYGTHNIMGDPQFVDADNGDFRLLLGSPAINIGDNTVLNQSVDLNGNPRVVGGTIDLGAFELQ